MVTLIYVGLEYVSGGFCHLKRSWLIFVSLRGTNMDIDSHISCSQRDSTIFSCQSIFYDVLWEIVIKRLLFPFLRLISTGLLARAPFLNSGWYIRPKPFSRSRIKLERPDGLLQRSPTISNDICPPGSMSPLPPVMFTLNGDFCYRHF